MSTKKPKKDPNRYPAGWNYERTKRVIDHYDKQTEDEAIAEAERAYQDRTSTFVQVPHVLLPKVRALIAKHNAMQSRSAKTARKTKSKRAA